MNISTRSSIVYRNGRYVEGTESKQNLEALIIDDLRGLGLTERESEVYLSLSKRKIMKAGEISRLLRLHKAQIYQILNSLEEKGLIYSSLEVPARFTAIQLDKFLNLSIRAKIEDAKHLEKTRVELLSRWRSLDPDASSLTLEKFQILSGRSKIYARILEMIEKADDEVAILASCQGYIQSYEAEVRDTMLRRAKRNQGIMFKLLVSASDEDLTTVKEELDEIRKVLGNIDGYYIDVGNGVLSRFVLIDEEAMIFITPRAISLRDKNEETALWTNNSSLISILRMFFERLWHDAIEKEKLCEPLYEGSVKEIVVTP